MWNKPPTVVRRELALRNAGSFVVQIDELVLEGFAPSEKYRIGDAVQRELERLFAARSEQTRATELISHDAREDVDAGAFPMNTMRGDVIGAQIAQAVFASLPNPK
jgi:hypothetical protein